MSFSTFNPPQGRGIYPTLSIRPGWVTRLSHLGKLDGEEHSLIGCANDFNVTEGSLTYGVLTDDERAAVESNLGANLVEVMNEGRTIRATAITRPGPARLTLLEPLPPLPETGVLPVYGGIGLADRESNAIRAAAAGARFEQQRAAALELRLPIWDVASMEHRGDFVSWLPSWVKELIREHSRGWIELPPAPSGFKPAPAIPPQLPIQAQKSSHRTMPQCPELR